MNHHENETRCTEAVALGQVGEVLRALVCEHIPAKFGFDRVDDIQVLSPMHRGVLGCRNLNDVLQKAL